MSRVFPRGLLSLILLAGAAGCATPARIPPEQASRIDPESGLVFGSVRISVDSSLADTRFKLAPGRKSGGATHELVIDCSSTLQRVLPVPAFGNVISFQLTLGEELILVQKLPARSCYLTLSAKGGFLSPMSTGLGIIQVRGGRTIYFGAVERALPEVIAVGSQLRSRIDDQKTRTVQALRAEYGTLFDDAAFEQMNLTPDKP